MKILVFSLLPILASSLMIRNAPGFSHENLHKTGPEAVQSIHNEEKISDNESIVVKPQYEENIYELVQDPEFVRCVTDQKQTLANMEIELKAVAKIIDHKLSETVLKIAEALLETFDPPSLHFSGTDDVHPKIQHAHSIPHSSRAFKRRQPLHFNMNKNKLLELLSQPTAVMNNQADFFYDCLDM